MEANAERRAWTKRAFILFVELGHKKNAGRYRARGVAVNEHGLFPHLSPRLEDRIRTGKRLPLEGKLSPQVTDEV